MNWREELPSAPPKPGKSPLAFRLALDDGSGFDLTEQGTHKRLAVYLVRDPAEVPGVATLGPDPLAADFTVDTLTGLLAGRRTQVKGVLRDQRIIAGIGNAYSDEVLHAAKMSPFKIAASMTPADVSTLYDAIKTTLTEAVERSAGLAAADLKGEKKSGLRVHGRTGQACPVCGDTVREVSLGLYRKLGDRVGQAHTHHSLGWMFGRQDRHLEALQHAQQALHLYRAADHRTGQARALNTVGWYRSLLGMHQQALAYCQQALDLHRELGNHDGQADAWGTVSATPTTTSATSPTPARVTGNALDLFRKLGDHHQQADILDRLGDTHYKTGDTTAAHGAWQQALAILEDLQHPDAEPVRDKLHKEGARD